MMDMLSEAIKGRLLFAIPKKGRLAEKCLDLLAGKRNPILCFECDVSEAWLAIDLQAQTFSSVGLTVYAAGKPSDDSFSVFLPAADIPSFVGKGDVDLGITGHDVILEAQMSRLVTEALPLGFGRCKLQVQVPEKGPIKKLEDLAGKRIVTSFEIVAAEYFAALDDRLGLIGEQRTKIQYVGGSVEAACALGLADGIVDLVESGETMRAAGLHAIATVLDTEACLIRSTSLKHPELAPLIEKITSRIAGVVASDKYVLCQYNMRRAKLHDATSITPGRRAATVSPLDDGEWVAVSVMVEKKVIADAMDRLVAAGAEDVLVTRLQNCRV